MHIFLYEFITGGGWLLAQPDSPPHGGLLREGAAMLTAVAADFAALADTQVTVLWDARLATPRDLERTRNVKLVLIHSPGEHRDQLAACATRADYALVIAPEFDGHLQSIAQDVVQSGGRLISPDPEFIDLASDKHRTAAHLSAHGVNVPVGIPLEAGQTLPADFSYPAVLKPRDGAGSTDVRLIATSHAAVQCPPPLRPSRLERCCQGSPASVAALCGPHSFALLPPCAQRLSGDAQFTYLGGEVPLAPALAARAQSLANRAFEVLPRTQGFVGLDIVLGDNPSGDDDVVIEVNPRLTTSYVGLRAVVCENLAAAILQTALGKPAILSLRPGRVEFTAAGEVRGVGL
jgi:predicted ATP-grasp superfamily ATP-dependent carboligase